MEFSLEILAGFSDNFLVLIQLVLKLAVSKIYYILSFKTMQHVFGTFRYEINLVAALEVKLLFSIHSDQI